MITEHKIYLNAAEIAALWAAYMNDSVGVCTIASFISHIEDREIQSVLEFALSLSNNHLQKIISLFNEEQYPVPDGFQQEHDVITEAPRLFTDDFCLFYIQNMGKIGLEFYTTALSNAARLDICEYFTECLNESARLLNKATEIMLLKGTFIRAPFIPIPPKNEYVQKQSYMAGFFGQHRTLNVIEISNIYYNLIQNQLGRTLLMGFSQVAGSQKVRDYLVRGRDIADKHVEIFGSLLSKEFLPSASAWDTMPTTSTTTTFSDKLMMFHATSLIADGIAHYGRSLALSPRRDLAALYVRLTSEILNYAEDGANIMIDNGWLEQPPQASDRDRLASPQ
ncbi:hypothetical protein PAECIP111891_05198 [Paenibacillus allorhizoplanae]|uniref:DUF3231 family protein n=1 Tax=Paenibacillus allorhizoplanae TaxID=2905648 RepID=A0ABN8H3B8_9BACL|nr:DUF3231 family protein [Paenibacillus allorhizoplanae]CAH1221487.1 hypothetical protein PAECIP111891_05198 [Paenibacillus allorhizoplanae]